MKKGSLALLLGAVCAASATARASEPDNFTRRPTTAAELADTSAQDAINAKTNQLLSGALSDLEGCNLEELHLAVKNALGGGEIGRLEDWATLEPSLKKTVIPLDQSIYAETGVLPNPDTGVFGTRSIGIAILGIVPSVVIGGHYVGVDKLGHFFDQGYMYYEEIYLRHREEYSALENLGLDDEDGSNGMAGNGIRSYGDMASNFGGFTFWRSVAQGPNPYFRCDSGQWVRTARRFDWAEYVSDAWDEAINCSEFSESVEKVVRKALGPTRCPVNPKACQDVLDQPCGFTYLSPACMPYVRVKSLPDPACARMVAEDQAAQSCSYEPGFWRGPITSKIADNADGAVTIAEHAGRAISRNVLRLYRKLIGQ